MTEAIRPGDMVRLASRGRSPTFAGTRVLPLPLYPTQDTWDDESFEVDYFFEEQVGVVLEVTDDGTVRMLISGGTIGWTRSKFLEVVR